MSSQVKLDPAGLERPQLDMAGPVWKYHLLRAALNRFQSVPADLDEPKLSSATRLALRSMQIESLALSSEEACDTPLSADQVDESVSEIEAKYADHADFLADLERNGLSEDGLRTALDRELRFNSVMDRVAARAVTPNELDVQLYYHMNKDKLSRPETRTARQILITVNEDFPENARQAALERIGVIAKRVANKPKRFAEQAGKHSECPTAMNGGLLGRVPQGQLYPELDAVLFSLREGQVSEVIESELGFHVLLCEQIHSPGLPTYKEAAPSILEHMKKRQRKICQQGWLSALSEQQEPGKNMDGKKTGQQVAEKQGPGNADAINQPIEVSGHG